MVSTYTLTIDIAQWRKKAEGEQERGAEIVEKIQFHDLFTFFARVGAK